MPRSLSGLFPEILEEIVSHVDYPADVLSLARTSRLLHDICIPNHLYYRVVRVSHWMHADPVWRFLVADPRRAENVRALHVGSNDHCVHFPSNIFDYGAYQQAVDNPADMRAVRTNFQQAFMLMKGLRSITWMRGAGDDVETPWTTSFGLGFGSTTSPWTLSELTSAFLSYLRRRSMVE